MFKTSYRTLGDIFQTTLYIGTLFTFYLNRFDITKSRVIQLFFLSVIIQIISWYNLHRIDPSYVNELSLTWLGYLFIFFFISYWLNGNERKINITMIAFAIGTVLTCLLHSKNIYSDYNSIISGDRVDYSFMNANHSAALLAMSLIIVAYISSITVINIKKSILLFLLSTISIFLLMGTQSRSAYVALVIPLLILIIYSLKNSKLNFIFTLLILLSVGGSFIYSSLPRVNSEARTFQKTYESSAKISNINKTATQNKTVTQNKAELKLENKTLSPESHKIKSTPTGNTYKEKTLRSRLTESLDNISNDIPYTSIGFRFHFWIDTLKQAMFTPLLGLGNNANRYILEKSNHSDIYKKNNFQHLHSSYMELIASYGLVGVSLLLYLYWYILNITKKKAPHRMFIFCVSSYSFLAIINIFESYLFVKSGVLIHTLVLGALYSYNFKGDIENDAK
ncbi:O-antigen ligase family protein [Vibrio crassostreae]|uniref:O-antigen ligase family protein n=1 Tax=Vibrio crassostreae TaxID=246167 RepID=UPI001FED69AD|nr:O-antigen ligase family protein [Vibrio crassostreae]